LGKFLTVDARTLGRVIFYLFSPILVFNLLIKSDVQLEQGLITILFTLALVATLGGLAFLLGKMLRLERSLLLAVVLTAAFGNNGNYGLPLVSFAFGEKALAYATVFFVTTSILFNTVGVLIASLGHMDLKNALLGLFKIPTVYAAGLAIGLNGLHLTLPLPLARTVELAANGSIPLMLVLLGLELTRVQWANSKRALGASVFVRMIAGPGVGLVLTALFGMQGAVRQANVVQASMPAAVSTTVLATEFQLEPALVTAIVFVSTVISPLTLTPLLFFLRR
ncbi:MAG: AEC family transporter, partial [Anaerolineae bacterium]